MRVLVITLHIFKLFSAKDIRAYDQAFVDLNLNIQTLPENLEIRYSDSLIFKQPGSVLAAGVNNFRKTIF